eukprot:TRINITY_DN15171_c0_g1_i1.p3 TRINITY_DN15171_c0_g1~~TRINITY_DN15171_c0_g1_i1.p3  ORF type:complete len:67 (+),score=6.38 TRINITY_DN15171_c0_g1_i1:397-597(+)
MAGVVEPVKGVLGTPNGMLDAGVLGAPKGMLEAGVLGAPKGFVLEPLPNIFLLEPPKSSVRLPDFC